MNGSGEKVASASVGFHLKRTDAPSRNSSTKSFSIATTPDANKIVQRVHVGRRARHQPPDRAAIEETHRQALQMLENFLAQVVHRFLPDPLHDPHLHVLQPKTRQDRTGIRRRDPHQPEQPPRFARSCRRNPGTM